MRDMVTPRITAITAADADNVVVTVEGGRGEFMRRPCAECPWRVDQTGSFPAEAFRISAHTAYDMADHLFGCHTAGRDHPVACAGFLLRGAAHNLAVRIRYLCGQIVPDVVASGVELHESYRAMAIANGVAADDPAITRCRS